MKESEAYTTYYDFSTGKAIPKPNNVRRYVKEKMKQAPKASDGKRIKSAAKVTRSGKKKQIAEGLETIGSGAHERTDVSPGVPDVPTYGSNDERISWKSSDEEDDDDNTNVRKVKDDNDQEDDDDQDNDDDQGDDDDQTNSDNDGDDFVHPKFSTHDEEDKEKDSFDPRVQTPSHVETTDDDDEDSDEEIQGVNVEGDDEEETNEEDEGNELYMDVNINLVRRDTEMTDAPSQQQSSSVSSGFISNMLNPSLDTGIDSIFNLNNESTSLVDVPVTTIVEPPFLSITTLPPPPIPLISHLQQTPVPAPATIPSSSL
nr:hypothetical protein [Tanacetum cinerariifolium]